jgi:hypothetical protein
MNQDKLLGKKWANLPWFFYEYISQAWLTKDFLKF